MNLFQNLSCLAMSGLFKRSDMCCMYPGLAYLTGGVFARRLLSLRLSAHFLMSASKRLKKSFVLALACANYCGLTELDLELSPSLNLTDGEVDLVLFTCSNASEILFKICWCLAFKPVGVGAF